MKNILHNVDDRQIPMITYSRKEISNTFVFAGLWHKIIQNDQISPWYVQIIWFVYIFRDAFIKLYSRHRSHRIKIRELPLTITPDDTLRGKTYSFLAFSNKVFTQTVLPLCVHPSTMQVKRCCALWIHLLIFVRFLFVFDHVLLVHVYSNWTI